MLSRNTGSRSRSDSCRPISSAGDSARHRHRARRGLDALQLHGQPLAPPRRHGSAPPAGRPACRRCGRGGPRGGPCPAGGCARVTSPSRRRNFQAISTPGVALPACTCQPSRCVSQLASSQPGRPRAARARPAPRVTDSAAPGADAGSSACVSSRRQYFSRRQFRSDATRQRPPRRARPAPASSPSPPRRGPGRASRGCRR